MKLVVGLGNPGKKYDNTRHNVGFEFLDVLAKKNSLEFRESKKFFSSLAELTTSANNILYLKPETFMNNSGQAVRAVCIFYKLNPENVIVIHDDTDIPLGQYKIQTNRGAAGHNGVQSIIDSLGTKNFTRIRIGVAPQDAEGKIRLESFVLEKFSKAEKETLQEVFSKIDSDFDKLI
jgi:PTH1 family peptidyl-tRNA hydrolase